MMTTTTEQKTEAVWIAGKVLGIPMPSRHTKETSDEYFERTEYFEAEVSRLLAEHADFQSFGLARGARACYFIEFASDVSDVDLMGFVRGAAEKALIAAEIDRRLRAGETPDGGPAK